MAANFAKEYPETWSGMCVDQETLAAYSSDAKNAAGMHSLLSLSLTGAKQGTVFCGLENNGIGSLRLQAGQRQELISGFGLVGLCHTGPHHTHITWGHGTRTVQYTVLRTQKHTDTDKRCDKQIKPAFSH